MTEHELLRIIAFLERVRQPFQELVPIAEEDATWNMLLFLMKNHLTGTPVAISTLASVAKAPHATAMRRIHALIERGDILQETPAIGRKGSSCCPARRCWKALFSTHARLNFCLPRPLACAPSRQRRGFLFRRLLFRRPDHPTAAPDREPFPWQAGNQVPAQRRQLLPVDAQHVGGLSQQHGLAQEFRSAKAAAVARAGWSRTPEAGFGIRHRRDQRALARRGGEEEAGRSRSTTISVRRPLLARFPSFRLVDGIVAWPAVRRSNLLHDRIARGAHRLVRRRTSIEYPTTFEKTVAAAKHFHAPAKGRYGIAWNGGRGMPIASTFMFLMGCCGELILHIPKTEPGDRR